MSGDRTGLRPRLRRASSRKRGTDSVTCANVDHVAGRSGNLAVHFPYGRRGFEADHIVRAERWSPKAGVARSIRAGATTRKPCPTTDLGSDCPIRACPGRARNVRRIPVSEGRLRPSARYSPPGRILAVVGLRTSGACCLCGWVVARGAWVGSRPRTGAPVLMLLISRHVSVGSAVRSRWFIASASPRLVNVQVLVGLSPSPWRAWTRHVLSS